MARRTPKSLRTMTPSVRVPLSDAPFAAHRQAKAARAARLARKAALKRRGR